MESGQSDLTLLFFRGLIVAAHFFRNARTCQQSTFGVYYFSKFMFRVEQFQQRGAIARRTFRRPIPGDRDYAWHTTPPVLTDGHFDRPEVTFATFVAELCEEFGEPLGEGNFGSAYYVETDAEAFVVKLPAEFDIHGKPWTEKEKRENLMHEAGVANELAALGVSIVPSIVYVELPDGSPALVREYGAPVSKLFPEEFFDLERALVEVEQMGWSVQDELELYERRDGTIFVGDVGVWHPHIECEEDERLAKVSTLDMLIRILGHQMLGAYDFTSLHEILRHLERYRSLLARLDAGDQVAESLFLVREGVNFLTSAEEKRKRIGLPMPEEASEVLDALKEIIAQEA